MNYKSGIAFLICTIIFAPSAFGLGRNRAVSEETTIKDNPKQEVINLDIQKIDIDLRERDPMPDNTYGEFAIFDNLIDKDKDYDHPFKIEEESLFGKIYKADIERTSIPSYLLRDELTFRPKKGPVRKYQIFGAYNGALAGRLTHNDYDTEYDFGFINLGTVGQFRDRTDFKLMLNVNPQSSRPFIQNLVADAYIMNTKIPNHKIIVGNSRNQVGFEGGLSSYILPFAMRSQISRNFGSTRAMGVRVVGNYPLVDYSLAMNSSDRFFQEFFPGAEFTGWVNLKPLGLKGEKYGTLVLGGGLNAGHNNTNYTVGGAYASYRYKKFMTNFEYAIADGFNGSYVSTNKATGFYSTISYRLTKKLHILARYDQFDPNRDVANNLRREYSAGFNYFIKGQALRLILNYVFCDNEDIEDSHRFILGTQILL